MGNAAKTGKTVKLTKVKVRFSEYAQPEKLSEANLIEAFTILNTLRSHSESSTLQKKMSPREEINGVKYIYVFRKKERAWQLIREYITQSTLKLIKWHGETEAETKRIRRRLKNQSISRGGAVTVDPNKVTLTAGHEYVVILSQVPLSFKRIRSYEQSESRLKSRGLYVPPKPAVSKEGYAILNLIDYVDIAGALQNKFKKAQQEYARLSQSAVEAKKRFLADMVSALADSSRKARSQLRKEAGRLQVEAFRTDQNQKLERLQGRAERAAFWKRVLMGTSGFHETERDYEEGPDFIKKEWLKQYAALLEGVLEHEQGLRYLEEVAHDPKSWMYRFFVKEEFQAWRKTIAATDTLFEEVLIPFLAGRIAKQEEALSKSFLHKVNSIVRRFGGKRYTEVKKIGSSWFVFSKREEAYSRITYDVGAKSRIENLEDWKKHVSKLSDATKMLFLGVELVNVIIACRSFGETYKNDDKISPGEAEELVNMTGSLSDLIGASEFLLKESEYTSSLVSTSLGKKVLGRIGVLGAICDYFLGLKSTYESSRRGEYGLAGAHATTALAAVALGTGAYLSSVGSGAVALGLASGSWLVIGALLFAGGMWGVAVYSDSDILAQCPWGVESSFKDQDLTGIREATLDEQIEKFADLIWQPQISVDKRRQAEGRQWTIRIVLSAPILLPHQSNFYVQLHIEKLAAFAYQSSAPSRKMVLSRTFTLPDDASTTHWNKRQIVRSFVSDDTDLETHASESSASSLKYKATIRARLREEGPDRTFHRKGSVGQK